MKSKLIYGASLFLMFAGIAMGQSFVNDDSGNKYGVWLVKYHKNEFSDVAPASNRNTDICMKLRIVNTNGKITGTLWRYRELIANETAYKLRGGQAGRITGFEFVLDKPGSDRKREKFSSNEVSFMDEQGKPRTVKIVGYWHTGKVKKAGGNKNRADDTLQIRVIDKPAGGGKAAQANGCVEVLVAAAVDVPCPEEPDTDVLEEESVADPEASPPYDGP